MPAASRSRPLTAAFLVFRALAAARLLAFGGAFVPAPAQAAPKSNALAAGLAVLGPASGALAPEPALASQLFGARYSGYLFDEILPYAIASAFSIMWGIVP